SGEVVRTAMTSDSSQPEASTTIALPRGFERHLSGPRAATVPTRSSATPAAAAPPQRRPATPPPENATVTPELGAIPPGPMSPSDVPRAEIPHYQPGPMKTSVTLLSQGESVRRSLQPRSFGYQSGSPPAQATPVAPSANAR